MRAAIFTVSRRVSERVRQLAHTRHDNFTLKSWCPTGRTRIVVRYTAPVTTVPLIARRRPV